MSGTASDSQDTGPEGTGALVKYEAAVAALAEARRTDEVMDIRDGADRLRAAATIARNRQLEIDAAEIRIRAERRLGELIAAQKETVGLAKGGRPKTRTDAEQVFTGPATLKEAGIDRKLSARAQKLAALPDTRFERDLRQWRARAERVSERVTVDLMRGEDKKARRAAKEQALGAKILALPEKRYGVIYADPPWRFEPRSRETGLDRAPDNHYPTETTEEIARMPVDELAADDAVLFLWATVPMLDDALIVVTAWGFSYRSHLVWKKVFPGNQKGTGYWFRNEHELLLVGVRGAVPAPAPGLQWGSVVNAPVGRPSAKPGQFRDLIDAYFPSLPKIELFARGAAPEGWDVFGNEAGEPQEARSAPARDRDQGQSL